MTPIELEAIRIDDQGAVSSRLPVVLRRRIPEDTALVLSNWLRSNRNGSAYANIPNEVYFYWEHRMIEEAWADPTVAWVVACSPTDPTQVYGWLCGQQATTLAGDMFVAHYLYVGKQYRRFGLASRLLATFDARDEAECSESPIVATHISDSGKQLLRAMNRTYVYNPYLFWARAPVPKARIPRRVAPPGPRLGRKRDELSKSRRETITGGFVPGLADPSETDRGTESP